LFPWECTCKPLSSANDGKLLFKLEIFDLILAFPLNLFSV